MSGRSYMQYSPSAGGSPQLGSMGRPSAVLLEHDKYISELLMERQKLGPFMQVLPNCSRLLNQEIVRVTTLVGKSPFLDQDTLEHGSPLTSGGMLSNGSGDLNGWSSMQAEDNLMALEDTSEGLGVGFSSSFFSNRPVISQASSFGWHTNPSGSPGPIVKKTHRIEVPVDTYPNFNFVGRILGPRGNSLKRVESMTGCRVMIRGRGSIKDSAKEEKMRDKPGYEHLNEPLHVLVEAELPASIIDSRLKHAREILEDVLKPPADESVDVVKKAQLRELAILNGTLREESPSYLAGAVTAFNNPGMKRPKTRR